MPKVVFDGSVFHPSVDPNTHTLNVKQVEEICHNFRIILIFDTSGFSQVEEEREPHLATSVVYEEDFL